MRQVDQALATLRRLFEDIVGLVMYGLATVEAWLRAAMAPTGLSAQAQTVVLLLAVVVLAIVFLRVFGGVLRVLLAVFLVLLALHVVLPALPR